MAVRIRMSRVGTIKNHYYRIKVANSYARRDGKFLELLGCYHPLPEILSDPQDSFLKIGDAKQENLKDPMSKMNIPEKRPRGIKRLSLDFERTKYWLSVGAQPSETVRYLLGIVSLMNRLLLASINRRGSFLVFPN